MSTVTQQCIYSVFIDAANYVRAVYDERGDFVRREAAGVCDASQVQSEPLPKFPPEDHQ